MAVLLLYHIDPDAAANHNADRACSIFGPSPPVHLVSHKLSPAQKSIQHRVTKERSKVSPLVFLRLSQTSSRAAGEQRVRKARDVMSGERGKAIGHCFAAHESGESADRTQNLTRRSHASAEIPEGSKGCTYCKQHLTVCGVCDS